MAQEAEGASSRLIKTYRHSLSGKSSAIHIALNLDSIPVLENTAVCLLGQHLRPVEEKSRSSDMSIADIMDAYQLENCTEAPCGH